MDEAQALADISVALSLQTFRPVLTDLLEEPKAVDLARGLPHDLEQIMLAVVYNAKWQLVAEQLALIAKQSGGAFRSMHVTAAKNCLRLAVVFAYDSRPISKETFQADFEFVWTVIRSLKDFVGRHRIDPAVQTELRNTARSVAETTQSVNVSIAAALIAAAAHVYEASRGPCATFVAVGLKGIDPRLRSALSWGNMNESVGLSGVPCLAGCAWSPVTGDVHGVRITQTVDINSLRAELARRRTTAPPGALTEPGKKNLSLPPRPVEQPAAPRPRQVEPQAPPPPRVTARRESETRPPVPPTPPETRAPTEHAARRYSIDEIAREAMRLGPWDDKGGFSAQVERLVRAEAQQAVANTPKFRARLASLIASRDAVLASGRAPVPYGTARELLAEVFAED
jgi:hypothetical protein